MRFAKSLIGSLLIFSAVSGLAAARAQSQNQSRNQSRAVLCEGFLPPNDLKIPPRQVSLDRALTGAAGITEQQFNEILDRVQKLFDAEITKRGGHLVINRQWDDSTVNSGSNRDGDNWVLNMFGGIARHPAITYEGFAMIACHEMGHQLGGAPKMYDPWLGTDWGSSEGEADYFAASKCLRQVFAIDDAAQAIAGHSIDPVAVKKCAAAFSDATQQNICLRETLAAQSITSLFKALNQDQVAPSFATPDPSVVDRNFSDHPATQCRLDTYLAGAICTVDEKIWNSDTDVQVGACMKGIQDFGYRPACWFHGQE